MQSESPLLSRARKDNSRNRLRIPRRGRIRVALFVVVCAAVVWVLGRSREPATGGPPHASTRPVADSVGSAGERASGERITTRLPRSSLSRDEVREVLAVSPPRLTAPADTVGFRKDHAVFHYSIDTSLQDLGRQLLRRYHPKYGAVVAVEPASGRVLALVSYNNPDEPPIDRQLTCRSLFPSASIFKVITAAGAIERGGMKAETMLRRTGANHTLYKFQIERELRSSSEISLCDAFAYSVNPVFGRIGLYVLHADGVLEYARRFGFAAEMPFDLAVEPSKVAVVDSAFAVAELASGFNQQTSMTPLLGALIAAAISNRGVMPVPTLVDSVTRLDDGQRLYRADSRMWRAPIGRAAAGELAGLMNAVTRYGTARTSFNVYIRRSGRFREIECGGKTGSVDKDGFGRVDWFVGFARHRSDPRQHIATAVLTVHGADWTVHSSFIAAEIMRMHVKNVQTKSDTLEVAANE